MPPSSQNSNPDIQRYRPGVGIVLFNADGCVFVGERLDHPGSWQLPQGGIDEGEAAEVAVFREMEEEIGTRNARLLEIMDEWLYYDIPAHTAQKLWDNKYIGQKQKWVALQFLGTDAEIDIAADHHPEFGRWKWVAFHDLLDYVAPFKRETYKRVIEAFAHLAKEKRTAD